MPPNPDKPAKEPKVANPAATGTGSRLDLDRVARILVEAAESSDRKTARKWQVTEKTIGNYRRLMATDPVLSDLFKEKARVVEVGWHVARSRSLRIAADRAAKLLETETDLDKISKFIERTGGVDIASEALGVGTSAHKQGSSPAEGEGGPPAPEADTEEP